MVRKLGVAAAVLGTIALALPVRAADRALKFSDLQTACVKTGSVRFGAHSPWPECRVTRSRWFSTIGLLDFYQAQYCLGHGGQCERRALVIYSNEAYAPDAHVLLQRLDPAGSEYDDPLVVAGEAGPQMVLKQRIAGKGERRQYYRWDETRWTAVDARHWLDELARQLPKGVAPVRSAWPDLDTMSAKVPLARAGDAACCPSAGVAEVALELTPTRFTVKSVKIDAAAQ